MKEKKKSKVTTVTLEPIYQVWAWTLLAWSLYRYFLKLPEWADEFIAKPLVFLGPVLWYVYHKEKRTIESLGFTTKNLFMNLYVGLGFGFVFALEGIAANAIKYGKIQINPIAAFEQYGMVILLVLSVATAISEEILNRGFLFGRIMEKTKSLPYASLLSTVLFMLLHVPILLTSLHLQGTMLVLFFLTDFILGMANSLLYFNTKSLLAPILVHVFWNMTVALYL
ncbi:MAG: CPBP family intramembrane metalloprotease [Candidatus Gottesmanbacteria bacterium]|nr:CPBP family intramembrane metalloprotease [Candidatus Gottesmanbacteria bacterium]